MKCPIQKVRALDETIDCNACGEFTCELRYGAGTLAGGGLLGTFARSDKGRGCIESSVPSVGNRVRLHCPPTWSSARR